MPSRPPPQGGPSVQSGAAAWLAAGAAALAVERRHAGMMGATPMAELPGDTGATPTGHLSGDTLRTAKI